MAFEPEEMNGESFSLAHSAERMPPSKLMSRFEYAFPGQMSNHPWREFVLNIADLDSEPDGTILPPLGEP